MRWLVGSVVGLEERLESAGFQGRCRAGLEAGLTKGERIAK